MAEISNLRSYLSTGTRNKLKSFLRANLPQRRQSDKDGDFAKRCDRLYEKVVIAVMRFRGHEDEAPERRLKAAASFEKLSQLLMRFVQAADVRKARRGLRVAWEDYSYLSQLRNTWLSEIVPHTASVATVLAIDLDQAAKALRHGIGPAEKAHKRRTTQRLAVFLRSLDEAYRCATGLKRGGRSERFLEFVQIVVDGELATFSYPGPKLTPAIVRRALEDGSAREVQWSESLSDEQRRKLLAKTLLSARRETATG